VLLVCLERLDAVLVALVDRLIALRLRDPFAVERDEALLDLRLLLVVARLEVAGPPSS
jgi:hypothetical protein